MGRKKHDKLDPELIAFAIDLYAGPQLMMISMRFPEKAEKLQTILMTACKKMYAEQVKTDTASPEAVILALANLIVELVNTFIANMMKDCLVNGMPQRSLIMPTNGSIIGSA